MRKKIGFCLVLLLVFCTGCRDRQENDDLTVVAGIAVDRGEEGVQLTVETLVAGGESEGGDRLITQSSGITLGGALLETANLTAQQLYYTHAQTLTVSNDLARQGLEPLLRTLERQNSFRLSLRIIVSQAEAGALLSLNNPQQDAASFQLRSMADTSWHNATSPDTPLYQFLAEAGELGVQGILPLAGLRGEGEEQSLEMLGTALFRDYTMIGTLNDKESQALLWMREGADGGLLESESLAFTVLRCDSKVTCSPEGGKIAITLELQEQEGESDRAQSEQTAKQLAEARCRAVLEKLRVLNCDAIGLGRTLMQQEPDQIQTVRDHWDTRFPKYPVEITVTAKLRDQGRIKEDGR